MRTLIIDGYNLLYQRHPGGFPDGTAVRKARDGLLADLRALQGRLADRTVVVWDGRADDSTAERESPAFKVVYTRNRFSADAWIEQEVKRLGNPENITVVSSDLAVLEGVTSIGCRGQSSRAFLDEVLDQRRQVREQSGRHRQNSRPPRLGDLFPDL